MRKKLIVVALTMTILIFFPAQAFANYYGIAQNGVQSAGGFFQAITQALDSKWSTTNKYNFILHTIWLPMDSLRDSWIEIGYMDGCIWEPTWSAPQYHKGFYTAEGKRSTGYYKEYRIIGPSTAIGYNHTYQMQRDGTTTWGVYVDYILRRSYSWGSTAYGMDVGLETNTTVSTSALWNERSFMQLISGVWKNWASGSLYNNGSFYGIGVRWKTQPTSIETWKN